MHSRRTALNVSLATLLVTSIACAQPAVGPQPPTAPTRTITQEEADREKDRLEKAIITAFDLRDFSKAEALLRELIPLDHENFVPWYNLACALSMQGKLDEACNMLQQAIARGFADLRQMNADEHLAPLREHPEFKAIVRRFDEVVRKRAERLIEDARKTFRVGEKGSPYSLVRDDALNLVYVSAFDAKLFDQARAEALKLERWWRAIAGDLPKHAGSTAAQPPVLVILPTRADYIVWAQKRFGDRFDRVGGEYSHGERRLVSMDLGSSWRHEFWHVLHWRDMDARGTQGDQLGQRHPLWVMEGLCSLVEDCDTGPKGEMIVRPNWRTNIARRLARAGNLMPWEVFMGLDQKRFMSSTPSAMYAQARAIFMFLAEKDKLAAWYGHYVTNFSDDQSGRVAMEKTFGTPIKPIEKDYRAWLKNIPEAPNELGRGPANLPFDVGLGAGDGPTVDVDLIAAFAGNKPVPTGGMRTGDVITALNDEPVRDIYDLMRVLAICQPGQSVKVDYRRGTKHATAMVTLVGPK